MIGSAPSELDWLFPFGKVPLSESKPSKGKGSIRSICLIYSRPPVSPFPHTACFCSAGGDIDKFDGIDEHAGEGITAIGDRICFKEAGS